MRVNREEYAFLKSLVAIFMIALCIWAAQWQYQRGVDRHARNSMIEKQSAITTAAPLSTLTANLVENEWRKVTAQGKFDPKQQILLKNRYFEGAYGFEVLTLFEDMESRKFWVDRGWVVAGATARTPPIVTSVPTGVVEVTGRLRLDSSLPRGAFFALPSGGEGRLISKLNAQSLAQSENFYLDLISGSLPQLTPKVPAQLPELSDGPHMAYALQWIFFAGLVIYGRILIRRPS